MSERLSVPFRVRRAAPEDVPALVAMERQLAAEEGYESSVQSTEQTWRRDGFGPGARFSSFVADGGGAVIGMTTYNDVYLTAVADAAIHIQSLFVTPSRRHCGVARALLAQIAVEALKRRVPLVHLNVHEASPAVSLYRHAGFQHLPQNLTYLLVGRELATLALTAGDAILESM